MLGHPALDAKLWQEWELFACVLKGRSDFRDRFAIVTRGIGGRTSRFTG